MYTINILLRKNYFHRKRKKVFQNKAGKEKSHLFRRTISYIISFINIAQHLKKEFLSVFLGNKTKQ